MHDQYRGELNVWDIGCDHAQLGLSFLDEERVKGIHLVDPSSDVMKELNSKLIAAHIPRRDIIKSYPTQGQQITLSSTSNLVFIAGMGGKEILDILSAIQTQLKLEDRVVVSPHRKILELRHWLSNSEFGLELEYCLEENQQFYEILALKKGLGTRVHPQGIGVWQGESGERYRLHILQAFAPHKDGASRDLIAHLKSLSA